MIAELFAQGKSEAQIKQILVQEFGEDPFTAQIIIDFELGRVQGDVFIENGAGQVVAAPPGTVIRER